MSGMSGMTLARPLQLARQAGHARRELLRDRVGGAAQRRVRGGERRVRHRDGDRRREGEGQRLPGPRRRGQDADRRHRPHAHRGRDVRDVSRPATARSTASTTTQMREVLARIAWKNHYNGARNPRAQFRKEVSMETICNAPLHGRRARRVRLLGCRRRLGGGDHRARRRRAQVHRQADLHQGAVARRRQLLGQRRPRPTTTRPSPRSSATATRRVRAGRHHQPASRARDGRGARLLHARPSCSSTRTSQFAERGTAWKEVLAGTFDLERRAAGEPRRRPEELRPPGRRVGAAHDVRGLAAAARRGARRSARSRTPTAALALTHNLGGYPGEMVGFVSILGTEPN